MSVADPFVLLGTGCSPASSCDRLERANEEVLS
jgi:hypothetical protein